VKITFKRRRKKKLAHQCHHSELLMPKIIGSGRIYVALIGE
jgi:hypothetical protein